MSNLNIVCLKWGTKYETSYVNKLYSMVSRHVTLPFDFYCITDDSRGLDTRIKTKPLPDLDIEGWWFKITLFKKNAYGLKGRILFFDLDMVIIDNIDAMVRFKESFATIKGWGHNYLQSAIFSMDVGSHAYVYERFMENYKNIIESLDGDQDWIAEAINKKTVVFFPDTWVASYKYHCNARGTKLFGKLGKFLGLWFAIGEAKPPRGTKVVAFHGKPDPEDVSDTSYLFWKRAPFVKKYWG